MLLNPEKLEKAINASGLSVDDVADTLVRPGLPQARARAAVRDWLRGGSTPKATPSDIQSLANAVGANANDLTLFDATHRFARISARKARLVADLIRDDDIDSALSALQFSKKRAAVLVRQTLDAAIASAEENNVDITRLFVALSKVDEGPTAKRFQPKDRGRAHPIKKRTSHITVAVALEAD
jgi:large subunit ribosomal protein L22